MSSVDEAREIEEGHSQVECSASSSYSAAPRSPLHTLPVMHPLAREVVDLFSPGSCWAAKSVWS